ncbi:MAG: hypothetical protein DRR06_15175 [Gammaproteobacteria bacterium]|nr:MAG: hypothetical protein DRR06_15175 [Gammaproteobacteria bacterium]
MGFTFTCREALAFSNGDRTCAFLHVTKTMHYIQYKHYTWSKWEQWGAYPSEAVATIAWNKLDSLQHLDPITMDGVNFHDIYEGYKYRLLEGSPTAANGLENRGV